MGYKMQTKICPICGRIFIPAVMHRFKRKWRDKIYLTCSYKCFTKLTEVIDAEIDQNRHRGVNKPLDSDASDVL